MSLSVQTNVSAMNTTRWLNTNQSGMESSLAKLSSGYQINSASDNPAGLVISEQLRSQIAGMSQSISNTEEAMNVVGIAEGALNEMNSVLISMNELALHAANNGVTSSDQVVADQAEMDSAVQTIDRIAKTTKYSDTSLLNGTQEIQFDADTLVDSTEDNTLVNSDMTNIYQITDLDRSINISYSGATDSGDADTTSSAQKASVEATSETAGVDIATTGTTLSADVAFTITGNLGSKEYTFGEGQELGTVAQNINDDAESTGVGAQLIFDSTVTGANQTTGFAAGATVHATTAISAYELDKDFEQNSDFKVTAASIASGSSEVGENTDADGCVYLKFGESGSYTIYKDAEMSMKVGTGTVGVNSTEVNDSGLSINVTTDNNQKASDVVKLQVGVANEIGTANGGFTVDDSSQTGAAQDASSLTGIRLGENTDANGDIYMQTVEDGSGGVTVNLYNDSSCEESSLMATGTVGSTAVAAGAFVVEVYAKTTEGDGATTGLYGSINIDNTGISTTTGTSTYSSTISADDLGIRLYSNEYGEDAFVEVEASEGALFTDSDGNLVDSSNDYTDTGQNGTVTVNGASYELNSDLTASISSTDLNTDLVMNEGELGKTTVAVAGYNQGALSSKAGSMTDETNHATQAMSNTSESLNNLSGGMNLQVGEGTSNDDSTVISIQSMTASDLGKVSITDDYDGDGIEEERTLTLEDLQGGNAAALAEDPDKALKIIDQAIDDVSMTRARLGAVQSNMLQTNINSLNVAVENITNTESAIRDTDMATESTAYTKNQILVQAATSMLAQANTIPQGALSLLG